MSLFPSVPDWRDNKSLLGFYNPLTDAYDDTRFLRFLLQAKSHYNEVDFSNYLVSGVAEFTGSHFKQLQTALLSGFQRDGHFARIDKVEIAAMLEDEADYQDYLQTLNMLLTAHDLHFGYRVFDEIMRFMAMADQEELFDDLDVAFDVVVFMKVLPKFNGPRNRLRQPLEKVIAWAENPDMPNVEIIAPKVKDASVCHTLLSQLQEDFYFPKTARKALRMLIRLHETGFASFA